MGQNGVDMSGRVCMVTGATQGVGRVTALELARQGATVVAVARDEGRGRDTVEAIRAETGNPQVTLLLCDLSSQASIRALAAEFERQHGQLHVLVNNAGALNARRALTVDGLEMTFAVNHLAYFLLTNLLLDVIRASAPARIVNVSSRTSLIGRIDFDDLQSEKNYRPRQVYAMSKLANVMFTVGLAGRLAGTGVTANALHPGVVATGFNRNNGPLMRLVMDSARCVSLTPERGAETQIYLATSPEVEGVSGRYFVKKQIAPHNPAADDPEQVERLWQVSAQLTGLAG